MKKKQIISWAIIVILIALLVWKLSLNTKAQLSVKQDSRLLMDTLITITVVAPENKIDATINYGFDEIARIAKLTDRFDNSTELSILNREKELEVSNELEKLILLAEKYRQKSNNAFDIRIGKLSDLWGFGTTDQKVPSNEQIKAALPQGDIVLNDRKVTLPDNVIIDLGALAKGYAIEKARSEMQKTAPSGLILGGGSSIVAWGEHPEKRPWRIGLRHPRESGKLLGIIELEDGWSLGSSGDYERYFVTNGKRYHHILDSRTGYPVEDVYACSVLLKDATLSDLLSTLLFVLGPDQGKAFLQEANLAPIAVFWVVAPGKIVTYEDGVKLPKLTY
ncbi:MAG TPA: FAD:protein FMN transferase [Firmicutes bacterium]|jgi:thiamine biosynthesis lipoprotein|nr:FAD:protein FMN transferase [Bacillota bacterium]